MANLSGNLPMRLAESVSGSPYHPRAKTAGMDRNPAPYNHPIRSPIVVGAMALWISVAVGLLFAAALM
jgi:hypothetical protein